jgi:peptidoglycan/LPS O-acetylase OafA/YrhL
MHKIKYLEGLRGVAALIVVFAHLKLAYFQVEFKQWEITVNQLPIFTVLKKSIFELTKFLLDANLAVWIFWMLSSYVISILFFKKNEDYDKIIVGYFSKRYLRLLIPVLASVLFAYTLLQVGYIYNKPLSSIGEFHWLNEFYSFAPNFLHALRSALYDTFFNYQAHTTYNSVLWSIQSEFLGSLFTFAIFGIIRHNKRRFLLYGLIALVVYKLCLFWLFIFIVGHVLCDYDFSDTTNKYILWLKKVEERIHKHSLLVLICSVILFVFGRLILTKLHLRADTHSLYLSIFIVYCCCRNSYLRKLFSSKIPMWLGYISFGLYLLHFPIICSLGSYLILENYSFNGKIIGALVALSVSLILSVPFTKYIDKKGVKLANRVGDYFKRYS